MSVFSMVMMTVVLTYSAPTDNTTISLDHTTTSDTSSSSDKPILRNQDDNTPGKCCTDPSKKCCPYDYDVNKCENMDTRKLCGYNKNQKKPDMVPVHVTKMGLDCRVVEERVECGYEKGANIGDTTTESKS